MRLTIGALAHVDAGKTSLCDAILYASKSISKKGRVDFADSFLDFNTLEKEKGITIFNKLACFSYKDKDFYYIDTPGHSDLAYESNRAINILDAAILIINGSEQIPADTIKQFHNLLNYNIPIIIFVNKIDITPYSKEEILKLIQDKLSKDCLNYQDIYETIALQSDSLMDTYLQTNSIDKKYVYEALRENIIFPVFYGSALKDNGIFELLDFLETYIESKLPVSNNLNAYLFKQQDDYSYLKVLSGQLLNKTSFGNYKINEIYRVNGNNYEPIASANQGDIVAIKGLKEIPLATYLPSFNSDVLYEVASLTYRIISTIDANEMYKNLQALNSEFPELKINLINKQIYINLNGELHMLIVKRIILERFGYDIEFSDPIIKYKETINEEVYGVGHFEPLRHYAEVIVNLKPNNAYAVSSRIDNNYISSLLSYLKNYPPKGILTNSPLINIAIEIVDIKTHPKHTEGGDLIEALKRAIRHALSKSKSILLEPFYIVNIDCDDETMNSIISELSYKNITYTIKEKSVIALISQRSINTILTNLKSRLKGNLSYSIDDLSYQECLNADEIIATRNYDYKSDFKNPAGSVFCKSGAGHYVEPELVEENMHLNISDYFKQIEVKTLIHNKTKINEDELNRVWNNLYKPKPIIRTTTSKSLEERIYTPKPSKPLIYLIDGYNLMYTLDENLALNDLSNAREKVIDLVCDFTGYIAGESVLVFDAYKANGSACELIQRDNISIVYTKEKQTADTYIELKSKELKNNYKVIVVTSDSLEQLKVFSNEASIISSREFLIRYDNFKKNNKHLNTEFKFRQLQDLKKLLED